MEQLGGYSRPELMAADRESPPAKGEGKEPQVERADPSQAPRILIVEDEWFIASEIEHVLREANCNVIGVATTAEDAVRLAEERAPDLVLMDIRLAGPRDGIAAAIEINTRLGIRSLYVTAHSDPYTRRRGDAANPLGWISKPIFGDELVAAVRDAIGRLT